VVFLIDASFNSFLGDGIMSKIGITPGPGKKPRQQKISLGSVVHHVAGPEKPYPVYQFSNRTFVERKGHNPFTGL